MTNFKCALHLLVFTLLFISTFQKRDSERIQNDLMKHKNWKLLNLSISCGQEFHQSSRFEIKPRILGGKDAAVNEFPWLVQLVIREILVNSEGELRGNEMNCGGSIINERYVLTAAHCCHSTGRDYNVYAKSHLVRLNGDKEEKIIHGKSSEFDVEQVLIHEEYDPVTMKNDICLLRLRQPITFSEIAQPICLLSALTWTTRKLTGLNMTVAGWGAIIQDELTLQAIYPDRLQKVDITVVPTSYCKELWKNNNPSYNISLESQFCGGNRVQDVCMGDSGGPVMYKATSDDIGGPPSYFLLGLTSFGEHCTRNKEPRPSVFIKVSHYMPWILDNIRE